MDGQEISKIFGQQKPGKIHYCHKFEAEVRSYPRTYFAGKMILDISAGLTGELELCLTPEGEDWENYQTTTLLRPISVTEY